MILFSKRVTKALIRLRGCAGWSVPLLFANTEDRFSRVEAYLVMNKRRVYEEFIAEIMGMCISMANRNNKTQYLN